MFFCQTGAHAAGEATQTAVAALGERRVVTALRGGGGKLVLIVWNVAENGQITRVGTPDDTAQHATLGRVTRIAIVSLGETRVVTAMRDDEGNLRLVVWNVAADGRISRVGGPTPGFGTATAGPVSEVAIAATSNSRLVTAMRDGDGNLRLIAWDVNAAGSLTRLGFATAGSVGLVTIVALRESRVATAIINGDGDLQVIGWSVSDEGDISRRASKTIGTARDVSAIAVRGLALNVVTAIRNGQGKLQLKLRLHGYGVAAADFQEEPFATSDLKSEVEIAPALSIVSLGPSRVFTAAQRGDILNVDVWDLAAACS